MSVTDKEIAQMMDLSCVQANSTPDEIRNAADTAIEYGCICVFTLPAHIPFLVSLLKGHDDIMIGGPVGFPDGGATTKGKVREAQELLDMGADELDMVLNIGWLKAGDYEAVARDIRAVVEIAGDTPVKVILECHYLTNDEIVKACEIAVDCGVAFVKPELVGQKQELPWRMSN